jgi:transcriptional regulator with XRE-family HTH domain
MADPSWFAGRLRELREAAGLSRKHLAERAGLKEGGVRDIEQGINNPTWPTVLALCDALGVDPNAFAQAPANPSGEKPGRGRPRKSPKAKDALAILETPVKALKDAVREERDPSGAETGEEPPPVKKRGGGKRKGG